MHPLHKILIRRAMAGMLAVSALLARRAWLQPASFVWSRGLAALTVRRKGIRPTADLAALGQAWQRGFPSAKQVPITAITADTVHARIETPCPLRGSGRTQACWRMMEYDRAVVHAAGGQFVVLQSQAEPGVTACHVALRRADASIGDLQPAHLRAPDPIS
jgi:hypothetical protein